MFLGIFLSIFVMGFLYIWISSSNDIYLGFYHLLFSFFLLFIGGIFGVTLLSSMSGKKKGALIGIYLLFYLIILAGMHKSLMGPMTDLIFFIDPLGYQGMTEEIFSLLTIPASFILWGFLIGYLYDKYISRKINRNEIQQKPI